MFNSSLTIKSAVGVLTVGAIGGVGYGIHAYNNTTDTVKNYLEKNNFTVIEKTNSTFWTKVLATYKLEKTEELSISSSDSVTSDNIRDWCDTNLNTKINSIDSDLFKKASKWCVNYETIEEKWTSAKFQDSTTELAKKYASIKNPTIKGQIDGLTVSGRSDDHGGKIKSWCDTNKKRRFLTDDNIYSNNIEVICLKAG